MKNQDKEVSPSAFVRTEPKPVLVRRAASSSLDDGSAVVQAELGGYKFACRIPGNACDGESILGNPFLVTSGLKFKEFRANNLERLASIGYENLQCQEDSAKFGKLGLKLTSNEIDIAENDIETSRLCSVMSKVNFSTSIWQRH